MGKREKTVTFVLIIALVLSSFAVASASDITFTDVKSSNWAYQYVTELSVQGGLNGYPDGTFKPSTTITSAEFVKAIIALIAGEIEPLKNDSHWASGYMDYAENVYEFVPEGMFEKSDWNKPITREKMGVIMERAAENFYDVTYTLDGKTITKDEYADLIVNDYDKAETVEIVSNEGITDNAELEKIQSKIIDYSSICERCQPYIVQAVGRGLIQGYADGSFKPQKTATRAEASTMIVRLIEPSYRVKEIVSEPIKTSTNVADVLSPNEKPVWIKYVDDWMESYEILENGDMFAIKYIGCNDRAYWIEYKDYGKLLALDKDKKIIDIALPHFSEAGEIVTDAISGKLSDTKYFLMLYGSKDRNIGYLFPNTLTAN